MVGSPVGTIAFRNEIGNKSINKIQNELLSKAARGFSNDILKIHQLVKI